MNKRKRSKSEIAFYIISLLIVFSMVISLLVGVLAGATVPFVTYIVDNLLHLDDATGVLVTCGLPALFRLLLLGVFADGAAGAGWQLTASTATHLPIWQAVPGPQVGLHARGWQLPSMQVLPAPQKSGQVFSSAQPVS